MKKQFLLKMISGAAAMLLLAGCGNAASSVSETESSTEPAPSGLNLVTLGDSISAGYGLKEPVKERYSALLTEMLEQSDNRKWNDYNYAVSGDDSSDLIRRLNDGRAVHLPSADAIILYIGANNLLGVYADIIQDTADEDSIDLTTASEEDIAKFTKKIEEKLSDSEAVTGEIQDKIDRNLDRLSADLETTYDWIRERNDTADIYVLNIYNPFAGITDANMAVGNQDFGDYAQEQVDRANKILAEFSASHDGLIPVDLETVFAEADPIPIIGTDIDEDIPDPHPNADGQKLIADTVYAVMRGKQ